MPVDVLLLDIVVILVAARLLGWLARKVGQPAVIGEILAGILLGPGARSEGDPRHGSGCRGGGRRVDPAAVRAGHRARALVGRRARLVGGRRAEGLAERLVRFGVEARSDGAVPDGALVGSADGDRDGEPLVGDAPHLLVRPEQDPDPVYWAETVSKLQQPRAAEPAPAGYGERCRCVVPSTPT